MSAPANKTLADELHMLVNARITSVVFVEDYVQIEISGSRMTSLEPLRLDGKQGSVRSGDSTFVDELESCVGAVAEDVLVAEDQLVLRLSNGKTLRITLSQPTAARETFIYQDNAGSMWVAGLA